MNKGLFINSSTAKCSIYESGKMIYTALSLSRKFSLDYLEISKKDHKIPLGYDFYAFNYHPGVMGWLNTKKVKRLPGLKLTFVLEVLPNDPFALCPEYDFDVYCAIDPTIKMSDERVYAFPRPLDSHEFPLIYKQSDIPVIGSFGFATPGKGFELLIDAVNREFEKAIVRINIPNSTFADGWFKMLQERNCPYTAYTGEVCTKIAKKGVEVRITHDYMSKTDLINWCGQNTLNVFLYNRNQPGLSATTDQAITSGRPLAVSDNETFRHIHPYIASYPYQTLRQSIENSQPHVLQMQRDWAPLNFAVAFERLLDKEARDSSKRVYIKKILDQRNEKARMFSPAYPANSKKNILIVSHKEKQCGIYEYGLNLSEVLKKSTRYNSLYKECSSEQELASIISQLGPDIIIYNYYPLTMPWLTSRVTRKYQQPQLGIMHEVTQYEADGATAKMFDFHLCPDPTLKLNNPLIFKMKRIIPAYINTTNLPKIPTIGSFGFGFSDKGFEKLIETVQREFDVAHINILMPFNDIVDEKGRGHAHLTAKRCKSLIYKKDIKLRISHDFLPKRSLLDFLAGNTINAFFYDTEKEKGISSTIEHALAVQRPLAITKCGMFRHVYNATPSICVEESSLHQIISNWIVPLVPFYNEWSEVAFIVDFERILDNLALRTYHR